MAMYRVFVATVVLLAGLTPFTCSAQDMWGKYCTWPVVGSTQICRSTPEEVMTAYNEPLLVKPIWEPSGRSFASSQAGTISVGYRIAYLPPDSTAAPVYNYNSVVGDSSSFSRIPGCQSAGCGDEETVIAYLTQQAQTSYPGSSVEISGSYPAEWIRSSSEYMDFAGDRTLKVMRDGAQVAAYRLNKFQQYTCRPGHLGKGAWNVGHAPPEYKSNEYSYAQLCGGGGDVWVGSSIQQRQTCPVNKNPCYPTTGDKARFETDFEFAGRPFVRSYHSTQQVLMPGIAAGWWITYGERTNYASGVDEFGFIDTYQYEDGKYRSKLYAGRTVQQTSFGYTSRDGDGTYRDFDDDGMLLRVYDPARPANDVQVFHDFWGRISALRDAQGREALFTYLDESRLGLLSSVTLPDGTTVRYEYDAAKNLAKVESSDGSSRRYLYDESSLVQSDKKHLLTGIEDEAEGRYASFGYDARGRVTSSKLHAAGGYTESTLVAYGNNAATVTTDGRGERLYTYRTNEVPNPTSIATTGVGTELLQYSLGRVTSETSPKGTTTQYLYSGSYLAQQNDAVGSVAERQTVYTRDPEGNATKIVIRKKVDGTFQDDSIVERTYNARGQVLTTTGTDPVSGVARVATNTYCEQAGIDAGTCPLLGLLVSVDGPRTDVNDITTFTYYPSDAATCASAPATCPHRKGDLWLVQDAAGNISETLEYDSAGRVRSMKNANGVITDFEYHPRGWLSARKVRGSDNSSEADDQITRLEYYPTGLVKKTTLPDGSATSFTYDTAHRLTDITDGEGNKIHYTLDNAGNRTKEETLGSTGGVLRTLSRVYNQLSQLQTHKDAYDHATGYVYDTNGNTDTVTDALGRVSDNDYDPLDRLTKTIQDAGGLKVTTQFQYDARNNITAVIDPKGLTTAYTYNGLGDLTRLSSPDTGATTYTYDSAGNRKTQTDARGITATYTYDALNRLRTVTYPTTSLNTTYTYDLANAACATGEKFAAGYLTRVQNGNADTQYCYDRFGNLTRKRQVTNGRTLTVLYGYTLAGQLRSVTYPDGTVADYVRDALGRVTEVGVRRPAGVREVLLTATTYYPFGPVAEVIFGNGRLFRRSLNQDYQPGFVEDASPGGLSLGYEFDPVGNLVKLRRGDQSEPPLRRYVYDTLNRLSESRDGVTDALQQGYSYDATGNRRTATAAGSTTSYTYSATSHRLTNVGGVARTYDAVGNTRSIGGTALQYTFSDAERMSEVKRNGTQAMLYRYNGGGEQVRRYIGTTNVYTVYDEAGQWLGEYDNAGAPIQQVVWLDGLPVGLILGATAANQPLHYIEADALATPRRIIDARRNVAVWDWPLTGEVFGKDGPIEDVDGDGVALTFNLRFPGQRYDAATGLNYNYLRDYDASTGRYSESDPIGLVAGLSTYAYVSSNPLKTVDPLGLDGIGPWTYPPGEMRERYENARGQRSRALTECERKTLHPYYPELDMREIAVVEGIPAPVRFFGASKANAWTFGNTIYWGKPIPGYTYVPDVPGSLDTIVMLGHELRHSAQYQHYGYVDMAAAYGLQDWLFGYEGNVFEWRADFMEELIRKDLTSAGGNPCGCH